VTGASPRPQRGGRLEPPIRGRLAVSQPARAPFFGDETEEPSVIGWMPAGGGLLPRPGRPPARVPDYARGGGAAGGRILPWSEWRRLASPRTNAPRSAQRYGDAHGQRFLRQPASRARRPRSRSTPAACAPARARCSPQSAPSCVGRLAAGRASTTSRSPPSGRLLHHEGRVGVPAPESLPCAPRRLHSATATSGACGRNESARTECREHRMAPDDHDATGLPVLRPAREHRARGPGARLGVP
jgi:hypothetical protein